MFSGMARLSTKADVLTPLITILVAVMLGTILCALVRTPTGDRWVLILLSLLTLVIVASAFLRVFRRYRRLRRGRCPNLMCRGVVIRSERVARDRVLCPTCQRVWPQIKGMRLKGQAPPP